MNKLMSMLGLARRAGKLSVGHDVVFESVRHGRAKLVILTSDASPRHKNELEAAAFKGKIITISEAMDEAGIALGKRSCIFSVDDEGFAKAIEQIV